MTEKPSQLHMTILIALAWLAVIGLDYLLNAGVFAVVFANDWDFLLTPVDLFRRIPLGYGSFLIIVILTLWVLERSAAAGTPMNAQTGARVEMRLGLFVAAAGTLGLASISPPPPAFWWRGSFHIF